MRGFRGVNTRGGGTGMLWFKAQSLAVRVWGVLGQRDFKISRSV